VRGLAISAFNSSIALEQRHELFESFKAKTGWLRSEIFHRFRKNRRAVPSLHHQRQLATNLRTTLGGLASESSFDGPVGKRW
jgi:hypothetical protein